MFFTEALEPETIGRQACLLICRQALVQGNVLQALVLVEYIYGAPILGQSHSFYMDTPRIHVEFGESAN